MTDVFKGAAVATILGLLAACSGESGPVDETTEAATQPPSESATSESKRIFSPASIDEPTLRRHIKTLSDDEFEGRAPATPGGKKARAYITGEMQKIGLAPANGDSYEQSVPLVEATVDPQASYFSINGEALEYGPEAVYWTKRVVEDVSFEDSELVFVGYGVVAPEYGWNDYEGVDAKGKTVVMLVNDPGFATEDPELFNGRAMTYYGRWTYKYEEAARQGADAAIVIHQTAPAAYGWDVVEGSWTGAQLDLERPDGGAGRVGLEGWVTEDVARKLFTDAGLDFDTSVEAAKSSAFEAQPMGDLTASGKLKNAIRRSTSANVAGMVRGAEQPDEYVIYMGHWDHLGKDESAEGDQIYNGAVDNSTGIGSILTIAESFLANETPPARSIIFMAVTAEESGVLGSSYFAEDPFVPLKSIVGGINIDGLQPATPAKDIIVVGYGASELEDILEGVASQRGKYLRPDPEVEKGFFYRSDHISLAKKGVPMLYANAGFDLVEGGEAAGKAIDEDYLKYRYHKPADEYSDDWDLSGMIDITEVYYEVGATMAYSDDWPNWYEGNEFRALRDALRNAD